MTVETFIAPLHNLFAAHPELAIFLALALGFYVGKIRFGSFQLGGVAGSLLVAVIVSQVGVSIHPTVQAILFALFIYAVGFESGPQFFRSLGLKTIKEIILAAFMALVGLATVVALARMFGLDKGLAAGIAAGGLTQSAIIGTASDAIGNLGLPAAEANALKANVATGYAVTYIFGSFGAILICANFLPFVFRRSLREDALKAEQESKSGGTRNFSSALGALVGRIYRLKPYSDFTVADLEAKSGAYAVSVEKVKRHGRILAVTPELALRGGDIVLLVGHREGMLALAPELGRELYGESGMDLRMVTREVALTNKNYIGRPIAEVINHADHKMRHGVFLQRVMRDGSPIDFDGNAMLQEGDLLLLYGAEQDVSRVASSLGYAVVSSAKTDFVYLGLGLVLGLLVGLFTVKVGGLPLTLGSGGGALLSGLFFGWLRGKRPTFGSLPQGAIFFMKDIGLAGFVACVGLVNGHQAITTIKAEGLTIFMIGVVVTILPLVVTMFFGRFALRYDNVAVLAGALSGSRSANPAFGQVLDAAGNSVPTVPFAVTYALANVFLTLLGPLIVAFA